MLLLAVVESKYFKLKYRESCFSPCSFLRQCDGLPTKRNNSYKILFSNQSRTSGNMFSKRTIMNTGLIAQSKSSSFVIYNLIFKENDKNEELWIFALIEKSNLCWFRPVQQNL